jgi:hypothetical protein
MEVDPGGYPIAPPLDATNNWWGSSSGPNEIPRNSTGTGDRIIDLEQNVEFDPWLFNPVGDDCPQVPPPPSTPGKVTGGGQIEGDPLFSPLGELLSLPALVPTLSSSNSNATFGFAVKCCPATGSAEYKDHGSSVRIKSLSFSGLFITNGTCGPNTHARAEGMASVTGPLGTNDESLTIEVDDCGQSGDTFRIETDTYSSGPPQTLIGGQIRIHK